MRKILPKRRQNRGFALVVTISLMILLAILAIGMLSLSAITLRGSSLGVAQADARANARLALMMAIGQLQEHAGDDRRISRLADQIPADPDGRKTAAVPGRRFWTGIYNSWDAGLAERPDPQFRAWLVSHPGTNPLSADEPTREAGAGATVELVGAHTAGAADGNRVEVAKLEIERDGRTAGRLAWWTGDQGVKAMLASDPVDSARDLTEVRGRLQAAPAAAVRIASTTAGQPFRDLDRGDSRLVALTDWPQASLFAAESGSPQELFHDLAAHTSGLLVNVRKGGFRRDLSLELEKPVQGVTSPALYTVEDGRRVSEKGINFDELQAYYKLNEALETVSGNYTTGGSIPSGTKGLVLGRTPDVATRDRFFHFKMPAVISLQVAFSLQARPLGTGPDALSRIHLALDPILTFWNPLDVPVVIPKTAWMTFAMFQFPYTIDLSSGRDNWECPLISTLTGGTVSRNTDTNFLGLRVGDVEQLVLRPGEVIKVSQSGNLRVEGNSPNRALQARAGFNFGGGVARPLRDKFGKTVDLKSNASLRYTMRPNGLTVGKTPRSGASLTGANQHTRHFALHYHQFFVGTDRPNAGGIGFGSMSIDNDFGNTRAKPGVVWLAGTPGTKPPTDRIYADRSQHADVFPTFGASSTRPLTVAQLNAEKAPILMYTYSAKTEKTSPSGTRAMLRFNPRAHWVDFYNLSEYERDLKAYDFQVEALTSWVNRKLETSASGNAFYGGSYDAADGNSFVISHSVPREPIHSLGALQHSMANGFLMQAPQQGYTALNARQPMLPQISHAIGNSFAPGVLSPDETSRLTTGGRPVADHSYLANLALWDDWFFSSVAPQDPESSTSPRDQQQVARSFLEGSGSLPITRYKPDLGRQSASDVLAGLFSRQGIKSEAVDLMASLIRVDGMFNVNSTSVQAWRALLSGLLGEDLVTIDASGKPARRNESEGVPVVGLLAPRESKADGRGAVPARLPEQWIGRRVLSEEEITLLAEAIVWEVRKRGPFLSLADFVNRRVGSDPQLARSGAIQSALDSKEVPINEAFNDGLRSVSPAVAGRLPFPEAEQGPISAGIPGIVKQADILTPLAPILSARSDSFLIRGYGEAVDRNGNITARAWCEALIRRGADYIDRADARETLPANLARPANKAFGRRFHIASFRWLGPNEI